MCKQSDRTESQRHSIADRAGLTAGWQDARAARHSFRHSSARVSLASSAARRPAAAASSRSRACSTLMLAWAALAASAVRRASRSCAAVLSLSCEWRYRIGPHDGAAAGEGGMSMQTNIKGSLRELELIQTS